MGHLLVNIHQYFECSAIFWYLWLNFGHKLLWNIFIIKINQIKLKIHFFKAKWKFPLKCNKFFIWARMAINWAVENGEWMSRCTYLAYNANALEMEPFFTFVTLYHVVFIFTFAKAENLLRFSWCWADKSSDICCWNIWHWVACVDLSLPGNVLRAASRDHQLSEIGFNLSAIIFGSSRQNLILK